MFPNMSRRIAALYKWLGLVSIPVLTVVTAVSVANVFTRGQLAQSQGVQIWWAIIFAAAIEVNIVRLFFESKHDNDTAAKSLGIGLIVVAGVSLIIEGIQQSIGFDWNNVYMQGVVGSVVGLRVIVVMFLLAREGSRLATMLPEDVQPLYACLVQFDAPVQPEIEQEDEPPLHIVPVQKKRNSECTTEHRIRSILNTDPSISVRSLAQKARVSVGTAQRYKSSTVKEA